MKSTGEEINLLEADCVVVRRAVNLNDGKEVANCIVLKLCIQRNMNLTLEIKRNQGEIIKNIFK